MLDNQQLTEACERLLELLDTREQRGRCNVCDQGKTARFVHLGDGEVACEDCTKNFALLALDAARCSVS